MNFGPKFAPDEIYIRWAWDHVLTTTDLPRGLTEGLYPAWREAIISGDPRKELAVLHDGLGDCLFNWRWLSRSIDWIGREIHPVHGWPCLWNQFGLYDVRCRRRRREPSAVLKILGHTIAMSTNLARDRAQAARYAERQVGKFKPVIILRVCDACPAEGAVARLFAERFAAGDGLALPPFFPGDRTSARMDILGGRDARPSEVARCPLDTMTPLWPVQTDLPPPALPVPLNIA